MILNSGKMAVSEQMLTLLLEWTHEPPVAECCHTEKKRKEKVIC